MVTNEQKASYDSTIHPFSIYKHMGPCQTITSKPPELPTKNEATANVGAGLAARYMSINWSIKAGQLLNPWYQKGLMLIQQEHNTSLSLHFLYSRWRHI